jgi:hypothetical protein
VFRVELALDGAHEWEGIAKIAPGVELRHSGWRVGQKEGAAGIFELRPEGLERGVDCGMIAIEEDEAEAGRLDDGIGAQLVRAGESGDGFGGLRDL